MSTARVRREEQEKGAWRGWGWGVQECVCKGREGGQCRNSTRNNRGKLQMVSVWVQGCSERTFLTSSLPGQDNLLATGRHQECTVASSKSISRGQLAHALGLLCPLLHPFKPGAYILEHEVGEAT